MKGIISSRFEWVFHPVTDSDDLEDLRRALVKDSNGHMQFAIWRKGIGWYDEGSLSYAGGMDGEIDVVEFSVMGINKTFT